jgi:hypothetical protein
VADVVVHVSQVLYSFLTSTVLLCYSCLCSVTTRTDVRTAGTATASGAGTWIPAATRAQVLYAELSIY